MNCKVDNCKRLKRRKNGMCEPHYRQSIPAILCKINDCETLARSARGFCSKHYQRWVMGKNPEESPFGRTYISSDGYIVEYNRDHIQSDNKGKVLQHRRIFSDFLGRRLERYENIHHKNGDRTDNRLENLELWIKRQPAGQRAEDLIEWAQWILRHYKDDK